MGDPCGIGAEIILRALADENISNLARFIIFGFSDQIEYTADRLELPISFHRDHLENLRRNGDNVTVIDYDELTVPPVMPRGPSKEGGRASMAFCDGAIDATINGIADGLITAPISKTSWHMAGHKQFPGHTELLARKCRAKRVSMMFVSPKLKVVLATIHDSIASIRDKFTIGRVFDPLDLANDALRDWFGFEDPKIAVCGLNPHAGENGQMGDDEQRVISPAITMATAVGINAHGPFPADTIYLDALQGKYDCVLAMYHDQGLIPIKLLGWEDAVNLTLGLPIIRTSPDHGTAFNIAGHFKANPSSMKAAIKLAAQLVSIKKKN